jgi:predicted O-methyltransferase YrrM
MRGAGRFVRTTGNEFRFRPWSKFAEFRRTGRERCDRIERTDRSRFSTGIMPIQSVLDFAHVLATRALDEGGVAVDATVGNGHDAVALARAVGSTGQVYGFDVQAEAIEATRSRIAAEEVDADVDLFQAGHETMEQHLAESIAGKVGAITFNLGYLPGSASDLTTTPETTIPALDAAVRLLRPGGVVTIVIYTGHEGGTEEAEAVDAWAADRPQERFHALSYQFVNQQNDPPRLVAVEKRPEEVPAAE